MNDHRLPLVDPTPNLSPKASVLLEAARRILLRDGLARVTYENVARESGETQSLIRYYFGDKAGLTRALVESEFYLDCRRYLNAVASEPSGAKRYRSLLNVVANEIADLQEHRAFLDVLADTLRDVDRCSMYGSYSDWYVELNRGVLASMTEHRCEDLHSLATLTYAVAEGLAMRREAGDHVQVEAALLTWERMVHDYLAERCPKEQATDGA